LKYLVTDHDFSIEQKMNLLRLSLNLLRRDWRAGEWRVLMIALVLGVGRYIGGCAVLIHPTATAFSGGGEWWFCRVDKRSASTNPFMKKGAA